MFLFKKSRNLVRRTHSQVKWVTPVSKQEEVVVAPVVEVKEEKVEKPAPKKKTAPKAKPVVEEAPVVEEISTEE